ncbi:type II toxin-antitoxin system death-on-curing family toxin [Sulfobacillus thermosulfidooxidans]
MRTQNCSRAPRGVQAISGQIKDWPGYDDAVAMQQYVVNITGQGRVGVFHSNYLKSALVSSFQGGYGSDFYPTIADKIAVLIHAIITMHVFVDANKRTAMALGLAVAEANGQRIRPLRDKEIEDLAVSVADHTCDIPDIAKWLRFYYRF